MTEPREPTQLYTVLVVSDHSQAVRKFRLPRRWLERGAWIAGAGAVAALAGLVHYFALLGSASENRVLKEENAQLRSQILLVQEKVAHISATLDRVERFDAKLRTAVTELSDPEKNLALGPLQPPPQPSAVPGPAPAARYGASLPARLDALGAAAASKEASLAEMQGFFEDQASRLASTPSIWPAHGWLTSEFGVRLDPYSAERTMHRGVDIATPHGAAVVAPSDGTVVFSGVEGSYGKVLVIDHGYGVKTRYGHLSEVLVAPGDPVKRGARVALVGNTGRSTGPHLHYEIRVNGIPENPLRFLME
ncbi:MAG TPA: M23 family metallopeptidase [Anaeromyxobacteraceae bacterium]|nr:M23 family metallopeptidase [Anaeromyxobacteraceae bacterium]